MGTAFIPAVHHAPFSGRFIAFLAALSLMILSTLFAPPTWAQDDPKARGIMEQVNARDEGESQISDMEMVLIDKKGNKRVRNVQSYRKDVGDDSKSMLFFTSPADVKGTGFLTFDYAESGKDDDQWLYLPALRKTKRIAAGDKSGSFMGSDFNYSDMVDADLEDYDFKLLKEVKVGGFDTWQIQSTPRSKDIANETGYDKSVTWVRKDNHVVVRGIRWVHKSRKRKYFQVKGLQEIKGIWVATELQMVTKEGKKTVHATVLKINNIRINEPMDEAQFTTRTLERGL